MLHYSYKNTQVWPQGHEKNTNIPVKRIPCNFGKVVVTNFSLKDKVFLIFFPRNVIVNVFFKFRNFF